MFVDFPSQLWYFLPLPVAASVVEKIQIMTSFLRLSMMLDPWSAQTAHERVILTLSIAPWRNSSAAYSKTALGANNGSMGGPDEACSTLKSTNFAAAVAKRNSIHVLYH